ncbi:thioredoxin family protein [Hyphomicrobium sp. 802]|uniref:thioredoxin family protein n=1 Tax=Hyphomicrobium sp. 802 TaxID=1112272 RepID=UPI00045EB6CD|nr:thioredoxin family protein [Hyphomicrobium sp. 802]
MIRTLAAAVFALFALTASADARAPAYADEWNGAEINWRDARSGIYESAHTGRPVIMVFHATWCSVCKRFRQVFKDPAVVAASRDFVMILVDADQEKEVNGAFQPDGSYVPRTLFLDSDGNVSDKLVGTDPQYPHSVNVDSPAELLALMKKAHSVYNIAPAVATPEPSGQDPI